VSDLTLTPAGGVDAPRGRVCPKCSYERKVSDSAPLWQCPRCGVAYDKVLPQSLRQRRDDDEDDVPPPAKKSPVLAVLSLVIALGSVGIWYATRGAQPPKPADQAAIAQRQAEIGQATQQEALSTQQAALESAWANMRDTKAWDQLLAQANQGHARSMTAVGASYTQGRLGKPDHALAIEWFNKAVQAGDVNAMVALGHLAEKGIGGGVSLDQALNWYRRAARQESPQGLIGLGRYYVVGAPSLDPNKERGLTLMLIARKLWEANPAQDDWTLPGSLGGFWARSLAGDAEKQMSVVEINKAKEAAAAWQPGQALPL
jgi:uncharacterized protein